MKNNQIMRAAILISVCVTLLLSCTKTQLQEIPLVPRQNDYLTEVYSVESDEAQLICSRPFYNPYYENKVNQDRPGFTIAAPNGLLDLHKDYHGSSYSSQSPSMWETPWDYDDAEWHEATKRWKRMHAAGYGMLSATYHPHIGFLTNDQFIVFAPGEVMTGNYYNLSSSAAGTEMLPNHFAGIYALPTDSLLMIDLFVTQNKYGHSWHHMLFESEGKLYQGTIIIEGFQNSTEDYSSGSSAAASFSNSDSLSFDDIHEATGGTEDDGFFAQGGLMGFEYYVHNPDARFSVMQVRREDSALGESDNYLLFFDGSSVIRAIPCLEKDIPVGIADEYVIIRGSDSHWDVTRYHFFDKEGMEKGSIVVYGTHVHFAGTAEDRIYFSSVNAYDNHNDEPYKVTFYELDFDTLGGLLK